MKNILLGEGEQPKIRNRKLEHITLLLVSVVIVLAFFTLYINQEKKFTDINNGLKNKSVIVLKKGFKPNELSRLLLINNYFSDKKDAEAIANIIHNKLEQGQALPNLGALNLSKFRISADSAEMIGGKALRAQVDKSRGILHGTTNMDSLYKTLPLPHDSMDLKEGDCVIIVKVQEKIDSVSWFTKFRKENIKDIPNVIVQLKKHYWLAAGIDKNKDTIYVAKDTIIGYATTNKHGTAFFTGLKKDGYYSVLPIRKGFEYGSSKGTGNGKTLGGNQVYSFVQKAHTIRLIDPLTYSQIKEDSTVTVRAPQDFIDSLVKYIILFFAVWWGLHFFLIARKKEADPLILPLLMTLTGICLVIMYAIHDPLTDKMLGEDMAKGIIAGVILMALCSEVNFLKFVNSQSGIKTKRKRITIPFDLFLTCLRKVLRFHISGRKIYPLGVKVYQSACKIPDGFGYLFVALLLAFSLFPFGSGPEGSDVKVNLFFFQPSEITKYLVVLFLAAFFAKRADYFLKITDIKRRILNISMIAAGIGVLLGIYMFLGDMGPALVLALTFIIIYSVARQDFPQLILGTASFALVLCVSSKFFGGSPTILATFALLWFVLWIAYGMIKKQIYESTIFLNLVIAAFIFGENIPNVGERLHDRNAIYTDLWNNDVTGGDQVVQGLWGLASGGTWGQGLGEGNPNLVPAFHTDMIFTSIGEELGWIGLLLIVLCLAILLHRSLLIGRRAAQPFLFYLAAGIAIVTGIQFLIITLGSVGLIPLTGIAVPFLSYGKVSLIINLAAFGIILSISRNRGSNLQKNDTTKRYDTIIGVASMAYTAFSLVLLGVLANYQIFTRDNTLVKPAFVVTRQGERMVEYNPRIGLLMKNLDAGIIYDRNGVILATNSADSIRIKENKEKFAAAGVADTIYTKEAGMRKQRYYPFGNNMFFWTGDFNSKLLWDEGESARGYIAERRHLNYLRGFDNEPEKIKLSTKLPGNKFLNDKPIEKEFVFYHYPDLIVDMLKDGINGDIVREHNETENRKQRDIYLTVDAALQTKLQQFIREKAAGFHRQSRVSVAVLGAENGEVLASANYPLPDPNQLKAFYENKDYKPKEIITDRDLGMTEPTAPGSTAKVMSALASFIKLGKDAEKERYYVSPEEIIHSDNGEEPNGQEVNMHDAIVKSSNVYFIKLVNDKNLYEPLAGIYWKTGIRVGLDLPYVFYKNDKEDDYLNFHEQMDKLSVKGTTKYKKYVAERQNRKLNDGEFQLAWGQSPISATPLSMARVVSIIANGGILKDTKYVMTTVEDIPEQNETEIVDKNLAEILKGYMKNESAGRKLFPGNVGGKSGTPQITKRANHKADYDGWYIFFVENTKKQGTIAVAVRIENVKSGTAARLAADLVKEFWAQTKE
ncbi:FtsW/RodA/SpoVE family cell cycle protein [Dysgonomonas termitidis]|uniref:FtsW/RodA/SpoVE family cell cycle protein n=1 Tax=Dysgonomonas termitidis TaxID=1516126 RepID=A0ABV9KRG0_9BACT